MANKIETVGFALPTVKEKARAVSSLRFDWIMVVVSVWWLGGLFIDGWAHSNIPQLETFFTPWHAVFYSGYLAVAFTLLMQILLNLRQSALNSGGSAPSLMTLVRESLHGHRWLRAIPTCYELSVPGLAIFGVSDIVWSAPFWAGAPVVAGITSFLLSFLMLPPGQVAEEKDEPIG